MTRSYNRAELLIYPCSNRLIYPCAYLAASVLPSAGLFYLFSVITNEIMIVFCMLICTFRPINDCKERMIN